MVIQKIMEERILSCDDMTTEFNWFSKQCAEKPTLEYFIDTYATAILKYVDLNDIKNKPTWSFLWSISSRYFNYPESLFSLFNEINRRMYNEDDYCDYLSLALSMEYFSENKMPYDKKYISDNLNKVIKKIINPNVVIHLISMCENKLEIISEIVSDKLFVSRVLYSDILKGDYSVFFTSSRNEEIFFEVVVERDLYRYDIHHWMTKHSIDTSIFNPSSQLFKVKNYDHDIMVDYLKKSRSKVEFVELCYATFENLKELINFIGFVDHITENGDRYIVFHHHNEDIFYLLSLAKKYFNFTVLFTAGYTKNFCDGILKWDLVNNIHNLNISALIYFSSRDYIQQYIQNNDITLETSLTELILTYRCFSEREIISYFNKIIEILACCNKKIYVYDIGLVNYLHMTTLNEIINHDVIVPVVKDHKLDEITKTYHHCSADKKRDYFTTKVNIYYGDMYFIDSIQIGHREFVLENKTSVCGYAIGESHKYFY